MASTVTTVPRTTHRLATTNWHASALWVAAAALLGFGASALFSGVVELSRNWFLVPYFGVTIPFLYAYYRWSGMDLLAALRHRWLLALIVTAVLSIFAVVTMLNQPASPRNEGIALVGDLLWLGVAYGIVDALLLTVLPVSAVWLAFSSAGHTDSWAGKVVAGGAALAASLIVTAAYHVGYAEFQSSEVASPLWGNGMMSLGYILTANPLTAIITHVVLHVTSVLHGIDTTVTLPPHYT